MPTRPLVNVFDDLSWHGLLFLIQRTDFTEPWCGLGFASEVKDSLIQAAKRKANTLDKEFDSNYHNDVLNNFIKG